MPPRHRSSSRPLAAVYAALVLYASLYPFAGWRWPPGRGAADLLALPWTVWHDAFDRWSNFLGYVPLGALAFVALARGGHRGPLAFAVATALTALLSYATEVTQHFLPGRHPSLTDWTYNACGGAAGAAIGAAAQALGWVERWQRLRDRWFVRESAGALALLVLWPLALLFPAPLPLGLGQIGPRLSAAGAEWLDGVPWAAGLQQQLDAPAAAQAPLAPFAEATAIALGLLAPCLVAYVVVAPGLRRGVLALGALAIGTSVMTLSTALNYGPQHAFAWVTPATPPALAIAMLAAALLAPLGQRAAAALGLVALTALVTLVAQAPADPYFAQSLRAWEQGRFIRFHGLAQWLGWLWPYAALGWLLARVSTRP